jgi:uncharacterized RDD family membrane protein YckC
MSWYYHQNGNSQGPVEAAEMERLFQNHTINGETLVWSEGMTQWAPYQSSPLAATVTVVPGETVHACAECGKSFPAGEMLQYENAWVCAACKPVFFQRIKEGVTLRGQLKLATIGHRFAAVFVDGILIGVLAVILLWPMYAAMFSTFTHITPGHPPTMPTFSVGFRVYQYTVSYGLPAAYEIFFIGAYGATLGKMLMKIKVVRPDGGRISYARATGRHFAKILSGIILYIGYLMAFWDDEKRALHDRMCGTRVITRQEA